MTGSLRPSVNQGMRGGQVLGKIRRMVVAHVPTEDTCSRARLPWLDDQRTLDRVLPYLCYFTFR